MAPMPAADRASLGRRAVTGAGWILAWRMLTRGLGFISTLVLARLLVPNDFGLVAMATAFAGAIDSLSQFAVEDALIRRIEDDTRLHDAAFTIQLGRAWLTAAIVALGAPVAAQWFGEPRLTPVLLVFAAITMIGGLDNIGIVEFQRQLRFNAHVQVLAIPRLLQVVATIGAALLTHSYWALLVGVGVQRVARVAVTYLIHPYRPRLSLEGWRDLAGFSFWMWAAGMASLVWERCDTFIVGHYFGSAKLGLYMVGSQVALLPVSELVAPAASVLMASFAFSRRGGGTATANAVPLAGALLLGVGPMALVLSAGAGSVVTVLLGAKWVAARPLIEIMAWICLFSPISYVCGAVLITIGAVKRQFHGVAVAAVGRVVILYFAARTGRLEVLALGTVASVVMEAMILLWQLRAAGYANLRRSALGLLRGALSGGVAIAVLAWLGGGWTAAPAVVFVAAPLLDNLLHLTWLGVVASVTFGGCVSLLWLASGRPEGPERIVFRLARDMVGSRFSSSV